MVKAICAVLVLATQFISTMGTPLNMPVHPSDVGTVLGNNLGNIEPNNVRRLTGNTPGPTENLVGNAVNASWNRAGNTIGTRSGTVGELMPSSPNSAENHLDTMSTNRRSVIITDIESADLPPGAKPDTVYIRNLSSDSMEVYVSKHESGGDDGWFEVPNSFGSSTNPWTRASWEVVAFRDKADTQSSYH